MTFGLADVLVEQLGTLDAEEEAAGIGAGGAGHLLGQRVGHGLGDERLAAAGRPVQENALGRRQVVGGEQLAVQKRQLDRVHDRFDLAVQAPDVGVGDVGHLFEHQLLDLRPGQSLDEHARTRLHQHRVAGSQRRIGQVIGQLGDPLLVGTADNEGTSARDEDLLDRHNLTGQVGRPHHHDVVGLVEHHFGTPAQLGDLHGGRHLDPHLATPGLHVDRAVVVGGEQRGVAGRGTGELVDLLAQRSDVIAGFAQREGELLVLRDRLGQLRLDLDQTVLEGPDAFGRLGAATGEHGELALGRRHGVVEFLGLGLQSSRLVAGRHPPLPLLTAKLPARPGPASHTLRGCRQRQASPCPIIPANTGFICRGVVMLSYGRSTRWCFTK